MVHAVYRSIRVNGKPTASSQVTRHCLKGLLGALLGAGFEETLDSDKQYLYSPRSLLARITRLIGYVHSRVFRLPKFEGGG